MGYEEKVPIRKPLHFDGIDTYSTALVIDDSKSPSLENVDLHPFGSISKRTGYVDYDPTDVTGTGDGEGLFDLNKPSIGKSYLYAVKNGVFYRKEYSSAWEELTPDAGVTVTSGARYQTAVARCRFDLNNPETPGNISDDTELGEALFIANGVDVPFIDWGGDNSYGTTDDSLIRNMVFGKYGNTSNELGVLGIPNGVNSENDDVVGDDEARDWETDPPAGFCLIGRGTSERLFAWGFEEEPSRVDYSETGVPWNFLKSDIHGTDIDGNKFIDSSPTDGGFFHAFHSDGDRVVAVRELLGYIVVFKERRTVIYSGDPGDGSFSMANSYPVGCISAHSIVEVGNDLMFWSEDGVHTLSAVRRYGDLAQSRIDQDIRDITSAVQKCYMGAITGYHDSINGRVIWFIPKGYTEANNTGIVYYYDNKPRWSVWSGAFCEAVSATNANISAVSDRALYLLGNTGTLGIAGEYNSDDGVEIEAYYETKWLDIGGSEFRKRALWIDLMATNSDPDGAAVYIKWDYNETKKLIDNSLGGMGELSPGTWDEAVFDEDYWDSVTSVMVRYQINGNGYLIKFRFESKPGSVFRLDGWKPEIRRKGLQ